MRKKINIGFIFIVLIMFCSVPQTSAAYNDWHNGYATYTGSGYSGGAFLLDPIPSNMEITAINPRDLNYGGVNSALAGAYLQVEGPRGKTIVYVTDLYPEGHSGALDLSTNAFRKIGNMKDGIINIKWKIVKAPITGSLTYRIKEGSSRWWAAIQVRNHKYPVMKMEYNQDGKWIKMEKTRYNHFVGTHLGTRSLKVRITDIRGKVVRDIIPKLPKYGTSQAYTVRGRTQFPD
ncbi:expansin EXLX1 family cellulose-binding protein [Bacillus changyiensis]|uniref:expansin EXLX1 family cellulose-binding protein n=1 Tax=Bacillus changyiensis TaxID=3004103 RepID=UPI0022E798E0|nr:expansin EXLX1 family cellulose-binding protein [Bacillus changyiensis]MDA1475039.1 expansin EXLX1 family cellulose-binding protein [Bacillus changyiensis]